MRLPVLPPCMGIMSVKSKEIQLLIRLDYLTKYKCLVSDRPF